VVSPPLVAPVALTAGAETGSLYLLDPGVDIGTTSGRIVCLDATGAVRQLLPPTPIAGDAASERAAQALADAQDIAVDEAAGVLYVVTEHELWRVTLPPIESVAL
jgi:hypothetical protein